MNVTTKKKPPKSREKSAALVTIYNAAEMTDAGRKEIAKWLRHHATMLVREGHLYTKGRFTGRYLYTP